MTTPTLLAPPTAAAYFGTTAPLPTADALADPRVAMQFGLEFLILESLPAFLQDWMDGKDLKALWLDQLEDARATW